MGRRLVAAVVLVVWFAALGWTIYHLQDRQISRLKYQRPYRDMLNVPKPKQAKILALGYDQLVSSLLFLRVIQVFGAKLQHIAENPRELEAIENVFNVITELDPHFIEAYRFGNFVLGDEGRDQEAALRLLDQGIKRNKNRTYRLAYEAIFICLTALEDYDRAREYVHLAIQAPDCPDYVKRMEYYIDTKKGNFEIALERWVRDDLDAHASNKKDVIVVTRSQIETVINKWHISIIEKAIDRYFERHQDYPARLEQLEEENLIATDTVHMVDGPRLMDLLNIAENARIPTEKALSRIMSTVAQGGCILESNRLPRNIRGKPYVLVDATPIPQQKRPRVVEWSEARQQTLFSLLAIRRRLKEFHEANGRFPLDLLELPAMQTPGQELRREDPAGMPWNYDPLLGVVKSYVFPDL